MLENKNLQFTIIKCYGPTKTMDKDMKEKFYQQLNEK